MLNFTPTSKVAIALVLLFGLLSSLPNFFFEAADDASRARAEIAALEEQGRPPSAEQLDRAGRWPSWLPNSVVNLGLDLQGGAHFLFEVQDVYSERLNSARQSIRAQLREQGLSSTTLVRIEGEDTLRVQTNRAENQAAVGEIARAVPQPLAADPFGALQPDFELTEESDGAFLLTLTEAAARQIATETVAAAIEVIRTRVDAYGTREPTIQRQGANRILVQLPGASDVNPQDLVKRSKLEFRLVVPPGSPDAQPGAVPYDPDLADARFAGASETVGRQVLIRGDQLAEAAQGFAHDTGEVGVNIRFNAEGARIFGELTRAGAPTRQRFAMLLDGKILTAPEMRVPINDGRAIITGDFSVESARALAVNLSSGSLPAELTVEESMVVGPELGQDSIDAGRIACIIGFMLVMVYMALSYGWFGVMANVALMLNVLLIFGALSTVGATLTLPGIAGIVLTIGMAVDANVLIFERIREELRRGRKVVQAIETGYQRAFTAIIDANVTTFLAALILFAAGSGPVRGFAVTLGIGIVTSVFTAVMLTRFFVATWFGYARPKTLTL